MRNLLLAALIPVTLLIIGPGCDREERSRTPAIDPNRPSVLLVTVDGARADLINARGGGRTGRISAVAETGTQFNQAFCPAPMTLPSHASLMTGLQPTAHGVRLNDEGALPAGTVTLAETCRAQGYATAAFVGSRALDSCFGLDRGFDTYDDHVRAEGSLAWFRQTRPADAVCARALQWLAAQGDTPFLLWVNFSDPALGFRVAGNKLDDIKAAYEASLAAVDGNIGRLVDWIDSQGRREKTLIIIAGSHGEAFGEHGEVGHGYFLYDTTLHVPLILSLPGVVPDNTLINDPVSLVDVKATLLDCIAGATGPDSNDASLRSRWASADAGGLPVYAETMFPRRALSAAPLRGIITNEWKYVDAPRPELYSRTGDPRESANVVEAQPDVARRLDAELRSLAAAAGGDTPDIFDEEGLPDPKDRLSSFQASIAGERLNSGRAYQRTITLVTPFAERAPDAGLVRATLGDAYLGLRQFQDAIECYDSALSSAPTSPVLLCRSGDALRGLERNEQAIERYRKAVEFTPGFLPGHMRLGMLYFRGQRYEEAVAAFRTCIEIAPESARALTNLANALPHVGQHGEAVKRLRDAIQLDPKYAPAHDLLWRVWVATDRRTDAIAALRDAIEAIPGETIYKRELAVLLATTPPVSKAAAEEAVTLATECCQAEADAAENHDALATAHAAAGNFEAAANAARTALTLARAQGDEALVKSLTARLTAYEAGTAP